MEKEVKIGDKTFVVKEIKYKDVAKLGTIPQEEAAKIMMQSSTGITDEEYEALTMSEGIKVQGAINEVNGITTEDFQKSTTA